MAKNLLKVKGDKNVTANLLPLQADPYKTITYKSPSRYNQQYLTTEFQQERIARTPSPRHAQNSNKKNKHVQQQPAILFKQPSNNLKKIDAETQTESKMFDAETQTDNETQFLNNNKPFNEEMIFSQLSDRSQRFSQLIKLRREIASSDSLRKPREAVSFMNEIQILPSSFSQQAIEKLEALPLMQVIFLQDPYTFKLLSDDMMTQEDIQNFLNVTSKEIEKKLTDLDIGDLKCQEEIAIRVKKQLSKFNATISLALQAFSQQSNTSLKLVNSKSNNIYDEMMMDMESQLAKYNPVIKIQDDSSFYQQFKHEEQEQFINVNIF